MDQSADNSGVGGTFGPYQLRSLLGKGGMGTVYGAYDTSKDRIVALKLLSDDLARDPSFQERFRRESRAAARLQEPHVIPIHDWGEIDGVLYIDMRLVPGRNLRAVLREDGPLAPADAVYVIGQIAAALDAAHADGLVHRDVKPENILITTDGFAYLVDFGIAHSDSDAQLTTQGSTIGSYAYMAPERFDVGTVDGRADTYSLACVLFEALTGTQPFPRSSVSQLIKSHLLAQPPHPSQMPGVPPAFDAVIATGMAKDPQARYRSAGDLARAAEAALSHQDLGAEVGQRTTVGTTLPPPGHGAPHPADQWQFTAPARKSPLIPVLLTLLAVLVVGLGGALAWVGLSKSSAAVVDAAAASPTTAPPATASPTTQAPLSTTAAVSTSPVSSSPVSTSPVPSSPVPSSPAPTTRSAPLRNVGVANADGQGFLRVPGARCNEANPAVAIARTSQSYVTVCLTGAGRYYYKGVRAVDGAGIEIDDPVPAGDGFVATGADGTKYRLDSGYFTISSGGEVLGTEPVLEYFRDR